MAIRVLHVIPAVAPRYGGPSVAVLGYCHTLRDRGVDVSLLTSNADGPDQLAVPLGTEVMYRGVTARFFARRLAESFKWTPGLARWARDSVSKFDVVHIHGLFSHATMAAGRAARLAGVPYIIRPLGSLDPWSLLQHGRRKRLLLRLGLRRVIDGAAAIHYTSSEERRRAEASGLRLPEGIVVPIGLADECFTIPVASSGQPIVLSLSRLDPKKGIDLLIAAFHRLHDTMTPTARLVIAGDDGSPYAHSLRQLAVNGPAAARIRFAGWVEADARAALLSRAALFALPSQQENFGIALAEAMAAGVPSIVSPDVNLSGLIEAESCGWISRRNVESLATTLTTALADEDERQRRGHRARQVATMFKWPVVAEQLEVVYRSVMRCPVAGPASTSSAPRAVS